MSDEKPTSTVVLYSPLGSRVRVAEHKLEKFLAAGFKKTKPRASARPAAQAATPDEGDEEGTGEETDESATE
jgi:hypothetical protein